jgi:hypothetical protein
MHAVLAGHLTATHCAYFKKWDAMMSLEEQHALAPRKEACSMPSVHREKQGNCCARMRVCDVRRDVSMVGGVEAGGEGGGRAGAELVVTFERFDTDAAFKRLFGWARRGLTDLGRTFSLSAVVRCVLPREALYVCRVCTQSSMCICVLLRSVMLRRSTLQLTSENDCQRLLKATASQCGPRARPLALCARGWWRR